jgi:hypothetical protein
MQFSACRHTGTARAIVILGAKMNVVYVAVHVVVFHFDAVDHVCRKRGLHTLTQHSFVAGWRIVLRVVVKPHLVRALESVLILWITIGGVVHSGPLSINGYGLLPHAVGPANVVRQVPRPKSRRPQRKFISRILGVGQTELDLSP